ncbi:HHIP-like protein 2 [Glandiceps talaboti]
MSTSLFQFIFICTATSLMCFVSTDTIRPKCIDSGAPFAPADTLKFCTAFADFGCCTADQDSELKVFVESEWEKLEDGDSMPAYCYDHYKNLTCMQCSPFSFDIFIENGEDTTFKELPSLCADFCGEYIGTCPEVSTRLLAANVSNASALCDVMATGDGDDERCYPKCQERSTENLGNLDCVCLQELAVGLRNPLTITHSNDDTDRLFIVEHIGVIKIMEKDGTLLEDSYLDIQSKVLTTDSPGDERGLLGLVFHPEYPQTGYFYVYYSAVATDEMYDHRSVVSRFSVSELPDKADVESEKILLEINQPAAGQNGGQLLFGPDGYLYISVGYGGADEQTAIDKSNLLGSILRIDVDTDNDDIPYTIPSDNPFIDEPNARPEIFAFGFRNPWRCSFGTGIDQDVMFCGDVGDSTAEEINVVESGGYYGWYYKEGDVCRITPNEDEECIDANSLDVEDKPPIHAYEHTEESSFLAVVGGYTYTGCQSPNLQRLYIYADYVLGKLWYLKQNSSTLEWTNSDLCLGSDSVCNHGYQGQFNEHTYILAFGEDENGEVYLMATSNPSNTAPTASVYRIVDPARRNDPGTCTHLDSITIGDEDLPIGLATNTKMSLVTLTFFASLVSLQLGF